jgi:hypothetical protein
MKTRTFVGAPVAVMLVVLAVMFAVSIAATEPALAAGPRQCVTAHVDAPFRLPDGLLYPAGALTLCDSRALSPVGNLHKILVGGSSVGLFVSRRRGAEDRTLAAPQFVFMHGADGSLELIGYTVPKSGRSIAYRLKSQGGMLQASSLQRLGGASAAPVASIVATTGSR